MWSAGWWCAGFENHVRRQATQEPKDPHDLGSKSRPSGRTPNLGSHGLRILDPHGLQILERNPKGAQREEEEEKDKER